MTAANRSGSDARQDRLREHPEARFAPAQHPFDLRAVAKELVVEQPSAQHGHRQKTLYRHGRVTIALFTFDPGAGLPGHMAAGVVTINVLDGRLRIRTPDAEHALAAGNLLILASGVKHDVLADERSTMLLQLHLDEPGTKQSK